MIVTQSKLMIMRYTIIHSQTVTCVTVDSSISVVIIFVSQSIEQ